eukprot:9289803-Alexandrium_andersonii.AAC.1
MLISAATHPKPQSALAKNAKSLLAFEPGTARAQKRPRTRSLELPRGAFCAAFRTDSESAHESGPR